MQALRFQALKLLPRGSDPTYRLGTGKFGKRMSGFSHAADESLLRTSLFLFLKGVRNACRPGSHQRGTG